MVKPVLQEVVLKKEQLFQEFCVARGDLYRTYRQQVQAGDSMYKQYERDLALAEGGDGHIVPLKKLKDVYTQRKAYWSLCQGLKMITHT